MKKPAVILAFLFTLSCLFADEPPATHTLVLETGFHTNKMVDRGCVLIGFNDKHRAHAISSFISFSRLSEASL
jgi:hypothetical protein